MPDPPGVSFVTRYVLENPWPAGLTLLAAAAALGWAGWRDGRLDRFRLAGLALVLGAAAFFIDALVTTSGERAEGITRQLLEHAERGNAAGAMSLFAADASLHLGSPTNTGVGVASINSGLSRLVDRYPIRSNTITMLDSYTDSSDEAEVRLALLTDAGWGPTQSSWILRIRRQTDGTWQIQRLTWVELNQRSPSMEHLR